jgi:hypothetical protein
MDGDSGAGAGVPNGAGLSDTARVLILRRRRSLASPSTLVGGEQRVEAWETCAMLDICFDPQEDRRLQLQLGLVLAEVSVSLHPSVRGPDPLCRELNVVDESNRRQCDLECESDQIPLQRQ